MRSLLYFVARVLGDATAIRKGRYHKRLANRFIGRHIVSKLWIR